MTGMRRQNKKEETRRGIVSTRQKILPTKNPTHLSRAYTKMTRLTIRHNTLYVHNFIGREDKFINVFIFQHNQIMWSRQRASHETTIVNNTLRTTAIIILAQMRGYYA